MPKLFRHFNEYSGPWPWPNFAPKEVSCSHCGEMYLDSESIDALQELRESLGRPIVITSGHRCSAHNKAVGGVESSQHLKIAFDCACPPNEQDSFVKKAVDAGFRGIGRYPRRGFVHLDMGPRRQWTG